MCKKSYVLLMKEGKKYKLVVDDMKNMYTSTKRKKPRLPKYEQTTEDEKTSLESRKNSSFLDS
jgi:hypothetical protein